ncbi:MAG: biotin--[acetyl-CoA-carboxylase] ligase [Planctomycetes bacterium]|nr:biotin--[acetyl-CoA-carboxylase] ligase [Planctomycetota bacterium]
MEFRRIHHGVVDSTSERAFAALAAGEARHGDVHLARGQTRGRGRQGRAWHSAPDEGLYASVVLLPDPPPYRPAALTLATALALIEALCDLGLEPFGERAPQLDWPNDVVVGGAKLSGVLTESRGLDPGRPHYVLGVGLNVRQRYFPPELVAERPVTSLALLGLDVGLGAAADALLTRLGERLGLVRARCRELAEDYLTASGLRGRDVVVTSGGEVHAGRVLGLSLSEGLELDGGPAGRRFLPLEFITAVQVRES